MTVRRIVLHFLITFVLLPHNNANRLNDWKVQNKIPNNNAEKKQINWPNGVIPYFFDTKSYGVGNDLQPLEKRIEEKIRREINNLIYCKSKLNDHFFVSCSNLTSKDHVIAMRLRLAMNLLESVSCIRFVPIIGSPYKNGTWLHISNPLLERDCMHETRYNETDEVVLVLGLDCLSDQQILHTLMHGVGYEDEVSHPHRDRYIRILWNNIQPAYHHLYRIKAGDTTYKTMSEYDPMSVMHFHDRAFSMNGQATIAPLMSGLMINPSDSLSQLDTMKLQLQFGHECNKRNANDLLDICKIVLHQEVNKKEPTTPSGDEDVNENEDINENDDNTGNSTIISNDSQDGNDRVPAGNDSDSGNSDKQNESRNDENIDETRDDKKEPIRHQQDFSETDE